MHVCIHCGAVQLDAAHCNLRHVQAGDGSVQSAAHKGGQRGAPSTCREKTEAEGMGVSNFKEDMLMGQEESTSCQLATTSSWLSWGILPARPHSRASMSASGGAGV